MVDVIISNALIVNINFVGYVVMNIVKFIIKKEFVLGFNFQIFIAILLKYFYI